MIYGTTYEKYIIYNIDNFYSKLVCVGLAQARPNYTFVLLHDSDHEGVVRIFVALSC